MPAIAGAPSPLDHIEPKAWDEAFAVNVTANWHLIRAMDPLLRRSDAGRAVFVTSRAATLARAYWAPYSVSKAALDVLARTYAAETSSTAVRVNLFDPGADAHAHARDGDAGRRPDDAADAGGGGGEDRRFMSARLCRDRQALRIPQRQTSAVHASGMT